MTRNKKLSPLKARSKLLKRFLLLFPKGFADENYIAWERGYKSDAHLLWKQLLNKKSFLLLLAQKKYLEIAKLAIYIEGKTNLLFSFEKMALRDALKTKAAAKQFSESLYDLIYSPGKKKERFNQFIKTISLLPRKQTRVLTWPLVTVFGFIATPKHHLFLKPRVTQRAAKEYQFEFKYDSKPNWNTYQSLIKFANLIKVDLVRLKPKDYIDLQSFIWTLGSDEYS